MDLPWRRVAACVVFLLGLDIAVADMRVEVGTENFRWREHVDGSRLVEESGPRLRMGAQWRSPVEAHSALSVELRGAVYVGRVDYDGHAQEPSGFRFPFQSRTGYGGVNTELLLAHDVAREPGSELLAGAGIDAWRRKVSGGDGVAGVVEYWAVFYLLAGGSLCWSAAQNRYQLRGGIKYPAHILQVPEGYGVNLEPRGRASLFARFTADFLDRGRPRWGVGVYWDSYRFARSDGEVRGSALVFQPESRQGVLGFYGIIYLR